MKITDWKPYTKNTLRGFFTLHPTSWLAIKECMLHEKNGARWIGFPAKPYKTKEGADGWATIIEISEDARERFQSSALAALRDAGVI